MTGFSEKALNFNILMPSPGNLVNDLKIIKRAKDSNIILRGIGDVGRLGPNNLDSFTFPLDYRLSNGFFIDNLIWDYSQISSIKDCNLMHSINPLNYDVYKPALYNDDLFLQLLL